MRSLWLLLALTACASQQPCAPKVEIQKQIVEVPRPCAAVVPSKPAPLVRPLPQTSDALIALLGAKLMEWAGPGGYSERAEAIITRCTKP